MRKPSAGRKSGRRLTPGNVKANSLRQPHDSFLDRITGARVFGSRQDRNSLYPIGKQVISSKTFVRITHRATGKLLAEGPLGWAVTPFEGHYYIGKKYLLTDAFRLNYIPGLCPYKFLYVWLDLVLPDTNTDKSLGWMYWFKGVPAKIAKIGGCAPSYLSRVQSRPTHQALALRLLRP